MSSSAHDHQHKQFNSSVIPTPLRLRDEGGRTGKGVTIAFLDSGFTKHPDLSLPDNRILAYEDVSGQEELLGDFGESESWLWHGTMTSVVASGNGFLSDGIYQGLAPESQLVLVKVSNRGSIDESGIVRGIEWVIANRERFGIRILNISLGSDIDVSYQDSPIDKAAERATREGIVVVVAAGNSGCTDSNAIRPPGNSPSVITVGGYDDQNSLEADQVGLYCSSYGFTLDGLHKPEVLAPAIWVAAPILGGTAQYDYAEALSQLSAAPDYIVERVARDLSNRIKIPEGVVSGGAGAIRSWVQAELDINKFVGTHYMHVDGTSFAAPITSSIIARMIEANSSLEPATIKNILVSTAIPIAGAPGIRQGFGVVNLERAVAMAEAEVHSSRHLVSTLRTTGSVRFSYHDDHARTVRFYSNISGWESPLEMDKDDQGIWQVEIPTSGNGHLKYKFLIDGQRWISDPANLAKEDDGFGGWNSIIQL